MSIRKTKLCDHRRWGVDKPRDDIDRCPKLAVGTCCTCDIDVCEEHTTNVPNGGISITFLAESRVVGQGNSRDVQHAVNLHICYECGRRLSEIRLHINETMTAFRELMRVALRAAFAEKALTAKGNESG